jgi:iron(II)-dependent oxidoreductase
MAVGCFPDGASVYGIEEMSGGIYQWLEDRMIPLKGSSGWPGHRIERDEYVLCGGLYNQSWIYARVTRRISDGPAARHAYYGFRCVND